MSQPVKVIVAENHKLTRKGYIALLKDIPKIEVVGEADNGKELIKLLGKIKTDLVLLDIEMPVMNGKEALKAIRSLYPEIKVIMVTFHNDEATMIDYVKCGANAFISKDSSFEAFVEAVETVLEEGFYYTKNVSKALLKEITKKETAEIELTEREKEIIILACEGQTNKQIASRLNIVVKTVDFHKSNIYKKTKTNTLRGLYSFALKHNLVSEKEE